MRAYFVGQSLVTAVGGFELLNLRAVSARDYRLEMGESVLERDGRVYFKSDANPQDALIDGASSPVVLNAASGTLALLSGTLLVVVRAQTDAQSLASGYQLGLKSYDESLKTAYLAVPNQASVTAALAQLRLDARVVSASPEVIQAPKRF